MNQRILELAEQAGFEYNFDPMLWLKHEKFAELIVKECLDVIQKLPPGYKDYRDQIEDAFRRDCLETIKELFGIKNND